MSRKFFLGLYLSSAAFVPAFAEQPSSESDAAEKVQAASSSDANKGLQEIVTAYVALSTALSSDDLQVAKATATRLVQIPVEAVKEPKVENELAAIRVSAGTVSSADSLDAVRNAFKDLSKSVIEIVSMNKELKGNFEIYRCPMTKGFNKWMQVGKETRNPYYGSAMLTCGLPDKKI